MAEGPRQRLALIEVVERDGRVRQQLDVHAWPVSLGRALDNDVVLDDPHVAASHAVLERGEGDQVWLRVGDTRNGVRMGRRTLGAGEHVALEPGEALQLGLSRVRVRLAGESLAAEKPLLGLTSPRALAVTVALTLVLWLTLLVEHWVSVDPDADLTTWLPVLLAPPVALAVWCGGWALASKLFQHRFEFGAHWAHAVRWVLALTVAGTAVAATAAAVGSPLLFRAVVLIEAAVATAWLFGHARLVLPMHATALAVSFASAFVVGIGVMVALNDQREEPWLGPLYMHQLPYPALRIERAQLPQAFVEQARALKPALDERAKSDADDEPAHDAGS